MEYQDSDASKGTGISQRWVHQEQKSFYWDANEIY